MKAKVYAVQLNREHEKSMDDFDRELDKVFKEFTKEVPVLMKARGARTTRALRSIIEELNFKWNSMGKWFFELNGRNLIKTNGFKNYLIHSSPDLKSLFKPRVLPSILSDKMKQDFLGIEA